MWNGRLAASALCVAALLGSAGCGGGGYGGGSSSNTSNPTGPNVATAGTVTVGSTAFTPASITVAAGSTVRWNWNTCSGGDIYGAGQTCVAHNVTFDDGPASVTQETGSFTRAFPNAGTFPYHCTIHGPAMSGRVVVQ